MKITKSTKDTQNSAYNSLCSWPEVTFPLVAWAASAASKARSCKSGSSASKLCTAAPWCMRRTTCSGRARPSRA
eukprot:4724672-Alexandrium_andersonii.AAC.1